MTLTPGTERRTSPTFVLAVVSRVAGGDDRRGDGRVDHPDLGARGGDDHGVAEARDGQHEGRRLDGIVRDGDSRQGLVREPRQPGRHGPSAGGHGREHVVPVAVRLRDARLVGAAQGDRRARQHGPRLVGDAAGDLSVLGRGRSRRQCQREQDECALVSSHACLPGVLENRVNHSHSSRPVSLRLAVRLLEWAPSGLPAAPDGGCAVRSASSRSPCSERPLVDGQQKGDDRGADQHELQVDADRPVHGQPLRADQRQVGQVKPVTTRPTGIAPRSVPSRRSSGTAPSRRSASATQRRPARRPGPTPLPVLETCVIPGATRRTGATRRPEGAAPAGRPGRRSGSWNPTVVSPPVRAIARVAIPAIIAPVAGFSPGLVEGGAATCPGQAGDGASARSWKGRCGRLDAAWLPGPPLGSLAVPGKKLGDDRQPPVGSAPPVPAPITTPRGDFHATRVRRRRVETTKFAAAAGARRR